MGVPVVGTPAAVEGMGLTDGAHVLTGRTETEFAEAMRRLYTDAALWERLSRQGQDYVLRKFGLDAARDRLDAMCSSLLSLPASRRSRA
jgi:O-antigen biosynthesis protein